MNVASLELCKKLHGLSGWHDTEDVWAVNYFLDEAPRLDWSLQSRSQSIGYPRGKIIPAYDLGYLLRKLPESTQLRKTKQTEGRGRKPGVQPYLVSCGRLVDERPDYYWGKRNTVIGADTPEDAVAKLAIELFKQGVLQKEVV